MIVEEDGKVFIPLQWFFLVEFSYLLNVVLKSAGRWRWRLWRLKRLEKWGGGG
jgi:hypothetical protein